MAKLVAHGAKLKCDQGLAPGVLTVLPISMADGGLVPAATVMDNLPMVNIAPFGMCKTQANPMVAAATAAAMGALTPMPCIPVVTAPWSPGSSGTQVAGQKVLTDDSKCSCMWSGSISVTDPGSGVDVG
jgi:hypothetical protein